MNVSKENLVVYLPFDADDGGVGNFAPARSADATLSASGCTQTEDAVFGRAMHLADVTGNTAKINIPSGIDYTGEFTICMFAKTSTTQIGIVLGSSSDQCAYSQDVTADTWFFVTIQQYLSSGTLRIRYIVNQDVVYDGAAIANATYFGIWDSNYQTSDCTLDEVRIYNRALTLAEIYALQQAGDDVEYYVDGVNFKMFGVEVSQSNGLLDGLARKSPLEIDWDNYHGKVVDLNRTRYQSREISLECFLVASDNFAFVHWVQNFLEAFQKDGLIRLTCEYAGSVKPLVYDVYLEDSVEIDKNWNDELMVGTFSIKLVEPSPIKRVYRHICQSSGYDVFTITTSKMVDITWGDGLTTCEISTDNGSTWTQKSTSTNLRGTALKVRHNYASAGEYDIVIHGVIENIAVSDITSTDIRVWNKL